MNTSRPICHVVAGPNGSGKSTFALRYLPRWAGAVEYVNPDLIAQGASEEATWDAIEQYRETGDLVPVMQDGRLELLTVAETLRSRRDYAKRRDQTGHRKCKALLEQFAALGRDIPPDLWDRLAADRKVQYEDELRWIEMTRKAAESAPHPKTSAQ